MSLTRDIVRRLPKAELHVHLDGCLRPATMLELAQDAGVALPGDTPEELAGNMLVRHARSLEEYLERYEYTLAVMQRRKALERIAYEFVCDVAAENVRYVEVRYCPALHMPSMSVVDAVEGPIAGLQRGEAETGCKARLIICGLRTLSPAVSDAMARAAVDYRDDGVVAFDLAGAEHGYPAADHATAFEYARGHGLACTCHAGEGEGPESVREALHVCGAHRIGHGTRIHEDPELEEYVVAHRVPLEICLTSNLHTSTISNVADHPARRYFDRGCVVTLNTDGRLMDGVTLTDEYWLAHTALDFTRGELEQMILNAFESAFLPQAEKQEMIAAIQREFGEVE